MNNESMLCTIITPGQILIMMIQSGGFTLPRAAAVSRSHISHMHPEKLTPAAPVSSNRCGYGCCPGHTIPCKVANSKIIQ